jgi:hypothetical protein
MQNKVNTEWACGNYQIALLADVSPEQFQTLANLGLRYLGQRNSDVDKILGAFVTNEKTGKAERIKGWKRNSVAFMPTLAEKLKTSFQALELSEGNVVSSEVGITEYVPTVGESKYSEEKDIVGRHESAGDLEEWLKTKVGFEGETHTEDGESFSPAMLQKVREYKKAALAAM